MLQTSFTEQGWTAFISPSLTQRCCRRWWYRCINQRPVQQTRWSHSQRRHGADEHGHAGVSASQHPEPWRHARPAQPAALCQHCRAEQSRSHRCCNCVWCRGPDRGEHLHHFPFLFLLVRTYWCSSLKHFQVFEPTHHLSPSKLVQHIGKQISITQQRRWAYPIMWQF